MAVCWTSELVERVRAIALAQGFELTGVAAAPAADAVDGQETAQRFTDWIDDGRAGEMDYLKRRDAAGELLRRSARVALPWVRSVIVCAFNYNAAGPVSTEAAPVDSGWIARYSWMGQADSSPADYHDVLLQRLRVVEASLHDQPDGSDPALQTRCYVDTGPLLERDFAARAGVGWIGKNTCVINQQQGSWLLLAVIVTSLELPLQIAELAAQDRCGSCTRCIDACPTDALIAPRQMDASRCIAYLTIEKKGEIPLDLREGMGRQVFGCDICQDVCPWNRRAPVVVHKGLSTRGELINPPLDWLAGMDDAAFRHHFRGSPLERTKRRRVQRNAAIAMGNSGQAKLTPRLTAWAACDDPVLAESAVWALERIRSQAQSAQGHTDAAPVPSQQQALPDAREREDDVDVFKDGPASAS